MGVHLEDFGSVELDTLFYQCGSEVERVVVFLPVQVLAFEADQRVQEQIRIAVMGQVDGVGDSGVGVSIDGCLLRHLIRWLFIWLICGCWQLCCKAGLSPLQCSAFQRAQTQNDEEEGEQETQEMLHFFGFLLPAFEMCFFRVNFIQSATRKCSFTLTPTRALVPNRILEEALPT